MSIEELVSLFSRLPGIGPRQARRFAYFLIEADDGFAERMVSAIRAARTNTKQCLRCFCHFETARGDELREERAESVCGLCSDPRRGKTLMIVPKDADLLNIEKSGTYEGRYFVLGGYASNTEDGRAIRTRELGELLERELQNGILEEIIIALGAHPAADRTVLVVEKAAKLATAARNVPITALGRGLSTGTELEYSDADTIKSALENRK